MDACLRLCYLLGLTLLICVVMFKVSSIVISAETLELALSGSAFGLLLLYHLYHAWEVSVRPDRTSFGRNSRARAQWATHVMRKGPDILAVQTLRNWTMGATLLASTAIVLALGVLSFALSTDGVDQLNSLVHIAGVRSHTLAISKALLAVFIYLIGFVSFSLCIRFYNHAAFLLNLPAPAPEPLLAPSPVLSAEAASKSLPQQVAQQPVLQLAQQEIQQPGLDPRLAIRAISRGAGAYNFGMRAYYISIPVMLWLLGPIWFFVGALMMTLLIYRLDHDYG
ncbi:hypothetical protein Thiowin_01187 [Thiorhodovibrio winogradskyi]|uniref:DUF599 domain-containing protein n=2 Tax=Thiorhodovibrio winogradskyi TaxID=77007 RepID=A0ABZ0S6T7_9GAMM